MSFFHDFLSNLERTEEDALIHAGLQRLAQRSPEAASIANALIATLNPVATPGGFESSAPSPLLTIEAPSMEGTTTLLATPETEVTPNAQ